jgi:hypothetical protein
LNFGKPIEAAKAGKEWQEGWNGAECSHTWFLQYPPLLLQALQRILGEEPYHARILES